MTEYVAEHPYPSYDDMAATLANEGNHQCCKAVYENPTDEALCAEMGRKVYKMGGMTGLRAMHRIVASYSPYKDSNERVVQSQGRLLEFYFEKSCDEWLA